MKRIIIYASILLLGASALSAVELNELRELARTNSPLIKQFSTIESINSREMDNLSTNYLPQFSLDGQLSYQSDVFKIPLSFPGVRIESPAKDQYQFTLSANQLIWDGGVTKNLSEIKHNMLRLNNANLEIKLYRINEAINNLYFNVVLIDNAIEILENAKSNLEANLTKIKSLVANGAALPSNARSIEIEISKLSSNINALRTDRKSAINALEYWIGSNLPDDKFMLPQTSLPTSIENTRPELLAFEASEKIYSEQADMAKTSVMPRISAFAKLGYGAPNQFNMMETDWNDYYIVGLRFSWSFFDWFNSERNAEIAELSNKSLSYDRQDFVRNIEIATIKDKNDIQKYEDIIKDYTLILNSKKVLVAEKFAQLEAGTATSSDYVIEYNSMTDTELSIAQNKIKKELTKINLLNKFGK